MHSVLVKYNISRNYLNITQESLLQMNKRIGISSSCCFFSSFLHKFKWFASSQQNVCKISRKFLLFFFFHMKKYEEERKKNYFLKMHIIVHNLFIRFVFYSSWTLSWCRRLRYNFICKFFFYSCYTILPQLFFLPFVVVVVRLFSSTFMPYRCCMHLNEIKLMWKFLALTIGSMLFYYSNFSNIFWVSIMLYSVIPVQQ